MHDRSEQERAALSCPLALLADRTGRDNRVTRIDIERTYRGFIELIPSTVGQFLRKRLPQALSQAYGDHRRIQVVDDGMRIPPGARVFVDIWSFEPAANDTPGSEMSKLGMCFFMGLDDVSIPAILDFAVENVDWDTYATNSEGWW